MSAESQEFQGHTNSKNQYLYWLRRHRNCTQEHSSENLAYLEKRRHYTTGEYLNNHIGKDISFLDLMDHKTFYLHNF